MLRFHNFNRQNGSSVNEDRVWRRIGSFVDLENSENREIEIEIEIEFRRGRNAGQHLADGIVQSVRPRPHVNRNGGCSAERNSDGVRLFA